MQDAHGLPHGKPSAQYFRKPGLLTDKPSFIRLISHVLLNLLYRSINQVYWVFLLKADKLVFFGGGYIYWALDVNKPGSSTDKNGLLNTKPGYMIWDPKLIILEVINLFYQIGITLFIDLMKQVKTWLIGWWTWCIDAKRIPDNAINLL